MNTINAPFTESQVDLLNQYQVSVDSIFGGHPFTCPNRSDGVIYSGGMSDDSHVTHGSEGGDRGVLIATESGFVCPYCGYTQDWAHAFMAQAPSEKVNKKLTLALATAKGISSTQLLLGRVDELIASYNALRLSRSIVIHQTNEEIQKSERILKTVSIMLESLNRRRIELIG